MDYLHATPVIFVQINDIYFIDARADYSQPGGLLLPRVATVVKRLRERFGKQVMFVLPGDFLAPSCLSKLFRGRQMVSVLNSMGLDYATFGNHEFESIFTPEILAKLIRRSKFQWLSANLDTDHSELASRFEPFVAPTLSPSMKLFLTGVLYRHEYRPFGKTLDPVASATDLVELYEEALKEESGGNGRIPDTFYAALTHQRLAEDISFSKEMPKFGLLMGGHDHDVFYAVDNARTLIVKAMSNARSIRLNCVVTFDRKELARVVFDGAELKTQRERATWAVRDEVMSRAYLGRSTPSKQEVEQLPQWQQDFLQSEDHTNTNIEYLRPYGDHYVGFFSIAIRTTQDEFLKLVPEDPLVTRRIRRWTRLWQRTSGESDTPILVTPVALNAVDKYVRSKSTNIGNFIADVVRDACDDQGVPAQIGLLNGGALRIDRVLPQGEGLSERTLCDLLFHKNTLRVYRAVPGARIRQILQKSAELRAQAGKDDDGNFLGDGDFLQVSGVRVIVSGRYVTTLDILAGDTVQPLKDEALYRVACNDYIGEICKHYAKSFAGLEYLETRSLREALESALRKWAREADHLALKTSDISRERWVFTD